MLQIVMSDFLFPASRLVKEARENPDSGLLVCLFYVEVAGGFVSL